jgi:hypothetical protein
MPNPDTSVEQLTNVAEETLDRALDFLNSSAEVEAEKMAEIIISVLGLKGSQKEPLIEILKLWQLKSKK